MGAVHDPTFIFCQCDACQERTFDEHKAANVAVGRPHDGCACGACRAVQTRALARIEAGFKRLEDLDAARRRLAALKDGGL